MSSKAAYYFGLDLGQRSERTGLVVLERHGAGKDALFHARHVERYPVGTSYPSVVADISAKLVALPECGQPPALAVDETAVGSSVVDLFRRAKLKARLKPIRITGGGDVTEENGVTHIPRRELVSVVQVALQTERLKIAASLPEAAMLVRELQNFQAKATESQSDTYGAWRESAHDDLVLSAALALWQGTQAGGRLITW